MESYFEVDDVKLWWKCEGGSLEEDLKPFRNDVDAMQLSNFVEKRKCDMKIYIEPKASTHDYTFMDLAREKNKGNGLVKDVYHSNDGEPIKTYNVDGASTTNELPLHNFITLEMGKEHVIEEEYIIDEIYIGKDDDNFEDKPNVIRFNER
ncbi:hypothetical protein KIW84_023059 [Lathyrus oleraceus]|uniref:Uncharacterized protein n=1 Tax=Pisum sativum TaxID=3888 RepID=A0A9D5BBN5_PEA|nr:hypothetical protein KIW84_023059 [Pisum sativum]